ncbi:elongator complex protein 6 [Spea bombifrons]|uniref:elongator complex protein 6 n=1 Tax=Spea bombifrons TaxID=233779 RepID=UPI0023490A50|nr:elongator complex protein 6 [Spea bombifrons]
MFPELNSLLGASTDSVDRGKLTLLCDRKTNGSFLLHHFLSYYLKAGCKVCFVGLAQSFSHYSAVAQKLGVNLQSARDEGQLVFLEGLRSYTDLLFGEKTDPQNPLCFLRDGSDLKPLYDFVSAALAPSSGQRWKCPVLIVDDGSVLLSLGVSAVQVLDFIHYCQATVCGKNKGNVLCLVHNDSDGEDEENELLVKSLWHRSTLILQAEGLQTGFCKDVHGQLLITRRALIRGGGEKDRSAVYQYKIQDKNVTFFARGLSAAVL